MGYTRQDPKDTQHLLVFRLFLLSEEETKDKKTASSGRKQRGNNLPKALVSSKLKLDNKISKIREKTFVSAKTRENE